MSNFIINNDKILKEKIDLLDSLSHIEIATKLIKESEGKGDIIDQHYEKLHCEIDYIEENTELHKILKSYLDNTSSHSVTLQDAYEVKREGDAERFKDLGNKMLLWHGSSITNYVGILSQGI